jgi:fructokinase
MILCAGDALIDMLPCASIDGTPAFAPHSGGAVFNTAVALGRLGVPTAFFSGLSRDMFGAQLARDLVASHVHDRSARSDRPCTLAFVDMVAGQARYAFYDENTAGRMIGPDDLPDTGDCSALFFGGISLATDPCGATYEALCARDGPSRAVMIDPNIRPPAIADPEATRARLTRMFALADIVKLSDEDLEWLNGGNVDAVLAAGPALVCITQGTQGVTAYTGSGTTFVPAHKAVVVDTVGAGDTFNAGLLAGLWRAGVLRKDALRQLDTTILRAALELGTRAAAITVARAGANPPWASDL